jgi:hypothetical protein
MRVGGVVIARLFDFTNDNANFEILSGKIKENRELFIQQWQARVNMVEI